MSTNFNRKPGISRATIIAIVAGVFIVAIAVTVLVLALLFPHKHTASTAAAPGQIIKDLKSTESKALSNLGYATQTKNILNATMLYMPNGSSYAVRLSATNLVSYSLSNGTNQDNKQSALTDVANYLENHGFANPIVATLNSSSTSTFESTNVVCQVAQYNGSAHIAASFNVACATHQTFENEQATIDSLLALYKANHTLPATVTDITRTHFTSDTKHLDALLVNAPNANPDSFTLYFAGLTADSTNYIGSQATVSVDSKTNPAPSSDLVAALQDKSYSNFLTSNIILNQ